MKKLPFAWLGSKRAKKQGAGDKAGLLDMGRRLGLPVPEGVVLLHRLYELLLEAGVIVKESDHSDQLSAVRIHCPDPHWLQQVLHEDVRLPSLRGKMIVRAAFTAANGEPIGPVSPIPDVDFDQPQAIAAALCRLWTAVATQPDTARRDLIIQKPVAIQKEGILFSDPAYQDDLVVGEQYSLFNIQYSVNNEQDVGNGEQWLLPQLRGGERAGADLPDFAWRLQMLLRGVRRAFGQGAWRVEWADDGDICWLLQVNPLPAPPVRTDHFVPITVNGLLPETVPPPLGELILTAGANLYDQLRSLDSSLPGNRLLVKMEEKRPRRPAQCRLLLNQSLLTDTLRHWGLPTAHAAALLGTENNRSFGWRHGRVWRRGRLMLRLALRQLWTAAQAPTQAAQWRRRAEETATSAGSVPAVSQTIAELWVAALTAHLCLLGPLGPDRPRMAQAHTTWRKATAVALRILGDKLAQTQNMERET